MDFGIFREKHLDLRSKIFMAIFSSIVMSFGHRCTNCKTLLSAFSRPKDMVEIYTHDVEKLKKVSVSSGSFIMFDFCL